ncbi:hypothetical protein QF036_000221 [Arthrobacter globiformis]|nr:hypothetical protein [Arthrobacter globiformis]
MANRLAPEFFFGPLTSSVMDSSRNHGKTVLEASRGPSCADMVRLTMTLFTVLSTAESTALSTASWASLWVRRYSP